MYVLQNDEEMFRTGIFVDKNEITDCTDKSLQYYKAESNKYVGYFWDYHNISTKAVNCVKFHGMTSGLKKLLDPDVYR